MYCEAADIILSELVSIIENGIRAQQSKLRNVLEHLTFEGSCFEPKHREEARCVFISD